VLPTVMSSTTMDFSASSRRHVNALKLLSPLAHSLGTFILSQTILLTLRVLFLVTLILVGRDVYMEHSGNASVRRPGNVEGNFKDDSGQVDNQVNRPPLSDPDL
jgi:hypothetical protein